MTRWNHPRRRSSWYTQEALRNAPFRRSLHTIQHDGSSTAFNQEDFFNVMLGLEVTATHPELRSPSIFRITFAFYAQEYWTEPNIPVATYTFYDRMFSRVFYTWFFQSRFTRVMGLKLKSIFYNINFFLYCRIILHLVWNFDTSRAHF